MQIIVCFFLTLLVDTMVLVVRYTGGADNFWPHRGTNLGVMIILSIILFITSLALSND